MNIALICTSEKQNIFSGGAGQTGQITAWGARCFARRVEPLAPGSLRENCAQRALRDRVAVGDDQRLVTGWGRAAKL